MRAQKSTVTDEYNRNVLILQCEQRHTKNDDDNDDDYLITQQNAPNDQPTHPNEVDIACICGELRA